MKIFSPAARWRLSRLNSFACLLALLCCVNSGRADDTNAVASAEADKVWKEVEKALRPPMPPAEWQTQPPSQEQVEKFRALQAGLAGLAADKAKEFYTRFPDHAKAAEARTKYYELLQAGVRLGNTNKLAELEERQQERIKDPGVSEEERAELRVQMIQRAAMAREVQGMTAVLAEYEKGAHELLQEFPKRDEAYQLLLLVADNSEEKKGRALAEEIIAGTQTASLKTQAQDLLKKLDLLGKPLAIEFTAVDGRDVELSKLTGKVVLVDFWATWCGPCVAEVPNVKKAYEKFHAKGFEIVGVSFDQDKDRLVNFVAKQSVPWPQYFDGLAWGNKFGQQFGIHSIPTMWLVDKKNHLRDTNGRSDLEQKVEKLLAE